MGAAINWLLPKHLYTHKGFAKLEGTILDPLIRLASLRGVSREHLIEIGNKKLHTLKKKSITREPQEVSNGQPNRQ
jgi:hypothetical protein